MRRAAPCCVYINLGMECVRVCVHSKQYTEHHTVGRHRYRQTQEYKLYFDQNKTQYSQRRKWIMEWMNHPLESFRRVCLHLLLLLNFRSPITCKANRRLTALRNRHYDIVVLGSFAWVIVEHLKCAERKNKMKNNNNGKWNASPEFNLLKFQLKIPMKYFSMMMRWPWYCNGSDKSNN